MLHISTGSPQPSSRWPVRSLSHCSLGSLVRGEHIGMIAAPIYVSFELRPFDLELEESFSTSALLTLWAGWFFLWRAVLCIVGCLAALLAEANSTPLFQL